MKLATEGVQKIAIHYRTGRYDLQTTLSLIEAAGASGVLVQGDVADAVAAENLVKEAAQKLGGCASLSEIERVVGGKCARRSSSWHT